MPVYDRGDVVLVHYPWKNYDDSIEVKIRPGLVLRSEGEERVIIQITSKNKKGKYLGKWILKDSIEGRRMGLLMDSFINISYQRIIHIRDIIRTIGSCSLMDEIDKIVEENGIEPKSL